MKCLTVYRHPGGALKCEPGISVVRTVHFNGQLCVRLGMNGLLSCENIIELGSGKRQPVILDGRNGLQVVHDVFPVETSPGTMSHRWSLCRPTRDDDAVTLVRFNFGAQVPPQCRGDAFPEAGTPMPVGLAVCAGNRQPWPLLFVDGMWIVSEGDVFSIDAPERVSVRMVMRSGNMEIE